MFRINGQYVMVDGVPAVVCGQCGEHTFNRETAEKVRLMVRGGGQSWKRWFAKDFLLVPAYELAVGVKVAVTRRS